MGGIGNTSALLNPPAVPQPSVANQRPQALITYAEGNVPPPSALYVGLNDKVRVFQFSHSPTVFQVEVDFRLLLPDGTIQVQSEFVNVGGAYTTGFNDFSMAEGFLLSVDVRSNQAGVFRGQVFINVVLLRNFGSGNTLQITLARGYCTLFSPVVWPQIPTDFPTLKPGAILQVTIGNPAAGADFTQAINGNARWRVQTLRAAFVTSAAAANRSAILQFSTAGNVFFSAPVVPVQAASLTWSYNWGSGVTTLTATAGATTPNAVTSLPDDFWLPPGSTIASVTQNIQAGDQWSAIQLDIEESLDV